MRYEPYRFARPKGLSLVSDPKLSVAIVIACRDGQEKLDLVLASLSVQSYPTSLTSVYVIDDASAKPRAHQGAKLAADAARFTPAPKHARSDNRAESERSRRR